MIKIILIVRVIQNNILFKIKNVRRNYQNKIKKEYKLYLKKITCIKYKSID